MRLLIDGNNFLMADLPAAIAGISEMQLCRVLARTIYATSAHAIMVVLDGAASPLRLTDSPVDAVELVCAGHHRSADDVMIEKIQKHTSPRRLTVVSSDREIRAAARRRRCRDVTSEAFAHELVQSLSSKAASASDPADKAQPELTHDEVSDWLKAFGIDENSSGSD